MHNAVVLEEVARMAWLTHQINPGAAPLPDYLLEKHYQRKHGKHAYYGQTKPQKRTNSWILMKQLEVWFLVGSQHLYGATTLKQVADHAHTIASQLNEGRTCPQDSAQTHRYHPG